MFQRLITLAACVLALAGLAPETARACGGFFCNNAQPVNQAAERIIFAQNDDGTTTAIIQIQYSGPSESFAWMLPVQGSPEIGVSSNVAFSALQNATNPFYRLNTEVEGECSGGALLSRGGVPTMDGVGQADAGFAPSEPEVTVVDSGSVGPYDFVIISVDAGEENVAVVATDWLNENDYDVSELGRDRLVPYLEAGMNLLAFRLTKGRDAGAIRPVTLSFGEGLPSIPLRPTAAAATPDMGIMVWILGQHRAIPSNYLSLELNEARIDWFNPNSTYNDVVTLAANEAGGQGFVTEFAGDAAPFEEQIFPSFVDDAASGWSLIEGHGQLIAQVASSLNGWDGMAETVLAEVPKPNRISEDDWNAAPLNYVFDLPAGIAGFDPESFLARIERDVLEPVRMTAALFAEAPIATRFYTTMSPDEMTMDPVFDFNADLGMVDNNHTQTRIIECRPDVDMFDAPWRITFGDGTIVRGEGQNWPLLGADDLPANRRIMRVGTSGEGEVIRDNGARISSVVASNNRSFPARGTVAGGSCSTTGGLPLAMSLAGLAFGLVAFRRRRAL